ncbi:PAS domain-containing protein [Thalassobaculum sp. OXR-137]|uniref:PAS domain-containing protein n=1 Tax=Thalassobaculum sp. OXR-137 TaxID=3100173 RepID=UPI002AC8AAF2|nr:PAS domain-containing protein [Thalassobaculum sp. OXR-137]WPZ33887.1 PAS domain-containing protein [Thalassobaculum sp. OXR-137]
MSMVDESLEYWESIRGGRPVPRRSDFDPTDIPRLLTHVVFLQVIDGGADFRFRVIGDAVRSVSFGNHTGQLMSSLPHISQDGPLMTGLRDAVTSRAPVRTPVPYEGPLKEVVLRDHLILPLSGEDGEITHLLLTIDLIDTRRRMLRAS